MPYPGPPIPREFTYTGTPGNPPRSDKPNTLDRSMIQTQRFFNSAYTGTYTKIAARKDTPKTQISVDQYGENEEQGDE